MTFALTQLEKIIAFFFGNRVPLSMACQFFAPCSGHPFPLTKTIQLFVWHMVATWQGTPLWISSSLFWYAWEKVQTCWWFLLFPLYRSITWNRVGRYTFPISHTVHITGNESNGVEGRRLEIFLTVPIFLFLSVHLLQFLEYSIAEFTLWPTYILELLLLKDGTPKNMIKIAAFFYGHGIPLSIVSRVYAFCNVRGHLTPFIIGAFYSTWLNNKEGLHMAKYL